MATLASLRAAEILDSRGRPTVKTTCTLGTGVSGSASVPSGRSTGTGEALELRDDDPGRYAGLGCRRAVGHVTGAIAEALVGRTFEGQESLDRELVRLDGTANKARLGANAIVSVSIAFARAVAAERNVPLYQHFAGVSGRLSPLRLPRLTVNLFSGGKHAGQHLAIQDVLVVPVSPTTIDDSLAMVYAVYDAAGRIVRQKYGQRLLRADEGGLSPPARSTAELLDDAMDAIRNAGLEPGRDVALAVDVAATHFCSEGLYHIDGQALTSGQMIELLKGWSRRYPILSFEDGLAEEDWKHWPDLVQAFAPQGKDVADVSPAPAAGGGTSRVAVMGDDLLCTHPARIRHAIAVRAADALLLKVNQIGTLTEAAEALRHARSARWQVTVSARSGETEDDWLADLAVGFAADYVKIGSITQSERLAKYNRLLEIERDAGLPLAPLPTLPKT